MSRLFHLLATVKQNAITCDVYFVLKLIVFLFSTELSCSHTEVEWKTSSSIVDAWTLTGLSSLIEKKEKEKLHRTIVNYVL